VDALGAGADVQHCEILVAVPSYGGSLKVGCVESLLRLQDALRGSQIVTTFDFTSYAGIASVRNMFGSMVLGSTYTHLLFVDSDMVFAPEIVLKLLEVQVPLIGCFYSSRAVKGSTIGFVQEPVAVPRSGLVKVDAIGMGLTLIESDCFRRLAETGEVPEWKDHPFPGKVKGPLLGFFDAEPNGVYTSEDYSFCRRWQTLVGGEVWALVREDIGHVGDFEYKRDSTPDLLLPLQMLGLSAA
jgi:hypothetical protein